MVDLSANAEMLFPLRWTSILNGCIDIDLVLTTGEQNLELLFFSDEERGEPSLFSLLSHKTPYMLM